MNEPLKRDRTVHRYPEVDLDILWDTIVNDLAEMLTQFLEHQARTRDHS